MVAKNIQYPVWGYNGKWAWKLNSEESISYGGIEYIEKGYRLIKLIDINLNIFNIKYVERVQNVGFFSSIYSYFNKNYKVKNIYEFEKNISFEEFLNFLIDYIKNKPEIYESGLNIKELLIDLAKCKNMSEVMDLLPSI